MIDLKELMKADIKFKKIWESSCKNHRILYFQINNGDEGIKAHFHPFGEDHALILEGELTYDISFEEQIIAVKNNLVFGWSNYVHGYCNNTERPLHILVFATPENNSSVYNQREQNVKNHSKIRHIKKLPAKEKIFSNRVIFSSTPPREFSNCLVINLEKQTIDSNPNIVESSDNLYVTFNSLPSYSKIL
ncbi:cupin domain-containing protein [Solibacillus sp. FSL R5-0449]|uniref:cupin domain-containing protein n=1 Tax=Solibacillus sp. FSL R5-0449 TaxID=2921639 RepID=UPI0030D2DDEE